MPGFVVQERLPQYVSDGGTNSEDDVVYERTVWASERRSLQTALDTAEREIDHLKKELRNFRGRFNAEGFMLEADREKVNKNKTKKK
jgi:valyl-tRNA synthetase